MARHKLIRRLEEQLAGLRTVEHGRPRAATTHGEIAYAGAPYGGINQSGIGREGPHHGMDEFPGLNLCVDRLE